MQTPRTWYATDKVGFHMLHTLFQHSLRFDRIVRYDEHFVTKLLVDGGRCGGVSALDVRTGRMKAVLGRAVILTTGGAGKVWPFTTNGNIKTGDGMAIAYREGVALKDMEFVQYHPTGLPGTGILITEAARGEGGYLINSEGERFLTTRDYGVGLQTHLSESKVQAVSALKKYGRSLAAHMDALGLVEPSFTAAHGVWLDDEDMKRLAARGASVAHNPGSNMRLGSGIADMRAMLDSGINVGIGTDGASSSDNLNMYEAMRIASLASKVRGPDWQRWITTKEVLEAATAGSASALGFGDKLGRLAPGCKADIVFLDLGNVNWIPLNDTVNALVHTEDGSAVHSVMVGGRMVLENRKLANVDLAKLAREAESARERLERLNRDNKALYERLEPIVGTFCPALAKQPLSINRYAAWR